uniref:Uncharacterized protein n=1 Tax=Triticum urartu TaxID=4572 RepID=A0A8R7P356_TRIUA
MPRIVASSGAFIPPPDTNRRPSANRSRRELVRSRGKEKSFLLPPSRSCESPPARPPSSDRSHLLRTTSHGREANCKPYCHGLWDYRKSYASGIPKST